MNVAWQGTLATFKKLSKEGQLVDEISTGFNLSYKTATKAETISWTNSLPKLAEALDDGDLDSLHVLLEFQMPVGAERADVILLGGTKASPRGFAIELKQWSNIEINAVTKEIVVPGMGIHLHPSLQVLNYVGKLRLFNSVAGEMDWKSAVFVHNAKPIDLKILKELYPADYTDAVPIFSKVEKGDLKSLIKSHLVPNELDSSHAINLASAPYKQSKHLFDFIQERAADIAADAERALASTGMGLTNEQARIKNEILETLESGSTKDFIIDGGPGSGKTLLAISLLLKALEREYSCALAFRNSRLHAVLKNVFDSAYPGASGFLMYFETRQGKGIVQTKNEVQLLICDEAQRVKRSNISELLPKAQVTAIFLDESQRLNPPEQGTTKEFETESKLLRRTSVARRLSTAVRCTGGQPYQNWVDALLTKPDALSELRSSMQLWKPRYKFEVYPRIETMLTILRGFTEEKSRVALVASFTESPGVLGKPMDKDNLRLGYPLTSGFDLYKDSRVNIPWLMTPQDYRSFWLSGSSSKLDRVASIYGCQGFESDYVGVIWGRDLLYRKGSWQLGEPYHCYDSIDGLVSKSKSNRKWGEDALDLVLNRYRIFLSRGIKGTLIFCEDRETSEYLISLL